MSQTAALFHLQTLDSQLDALRKRLVEIDSLLSQNATVRAAQNALAEAEKSLTSWRSKQTNFELERDQYQDEAKTAELRLYSGQVFNPREMTDLQDKITELNHRRETLEEPTLEAMLAIEDGNEALKARQAELEQVLADQAESFGTLGTEKIDLTARCAALEAEAGTVRDTIQAPHLALYDRLRKKSPVAVTQIDDTGCGVCGVELTTQFVQGVRHDEIVPCPTCGRIMVI